MQRMSVFLLQQMKSAWDKPEFWTSQQLLIPKVINITRMQATRVEELKDQLARLGLEIDQYGDEHVIVGRVLFYIKPTLKRWYLNY